MLYAPKSGLTLACRSKLLATCYLSSGSHVTVLLVDVAKSTGSKRLVNTYFKIN